MSEQEIPVFVASQHEEVLTLAEAASFLRVTEDALTELASERLLNSFLRLDPNDAAGEHFERLRKAKKTRNMRRGDMLSACIALTHEAMLVTRNVKDYKDVPGLSVENWAD